MKSKTGKTKRGAVKPASSVKGKGSIGKMADSRRLQFDLAVQKLKGEARIAKDKAPPARP
jgi:hypothetical protein